MPTTTLEAGSARALGAAAILAAALSFVFWASGALFPTVLPSYASSERQVTGMVLMLILVPPYLVAAMAVSNRRSLDLIEQLRPMLLDPGAADDAVAKVRNGLRRNWKAGTAIGIVFGLLNTDPLRALGAGPAQAVETSISLGQLLLWLLIGLLLAWRFAVTGAFRQLGESVSFDLFHLDRLRPLARAGVIDIVIIAGALLLSPLQSLDAEFRWYNYRFGLLVGLPAAAFFLVWPLLGVHRRIRRDRDARLETVESRLDALQPDSLEATLQQELLLAHRDRLRSARTWPLSGGLLSRAGLYLVLPPLAWAGAALVERLLSSVLPG